MIISHKHSFIFIKLRKTAGTSLEIALSGICGDDDIITPISKEDEVVRRELGYRGPQNVFVPKTHYSIGDWINLLSRGERKVFYNHMPAREIRNCIPGKTWNRYFKFCFERNPWDRAISAYYWENRRQKKLPDFYAYLEELQRKNLISNFPIYSIDGRIAVDRVFRYENLAAELPQIAETLRLPGPLTLARAKQQFRKDRRPYREVYTEKERQFVATACAREISELGYTF